jgi:endonuclease/exonuclease/phosphatase family metal-dependent hydrolase
MFPLSLIRVSLGALLLMSSLVCGTDALASKESLADRPDLLVMTFNIRYGTADDKENSWANRKDLVVDVLRKHDPDVVGLQEALRSQLDDIRAALPQYGEIGVGRDDGQTKGEYSAILYKEDRFTVAESGTFWLSDTPEVCGSITWGNNCTRVCTWGRFVPKETGKAFYLFNTHLDHVSQYSRERSAILLTSRIRDRAQKDPFVLTGDFNTGEDNPVVRYLKGEQELHIAGDGQSKNPIPLIDTFRALHPDASEVGTFHTFKGVRTNAKIDYIFAEPGTKVLQAEILHDNKDNRYPSDHFPVKAAIRFPVQTAN